MFHTFERTSFEPWGIKRYLAIKQNMNRGYLWTVYRGENAAAAMRSCQLTISDAESFVVKRLHVYKPSQHIPYRMIDT